MSMTDELRPDGPRDEPQRNEWFIAELDGGRCYECRKSFKEGDRIAWLWKPGKTKLDNKDWHVHYEHWYDNEWFFKNNVVPPAIGEVTGPSLQDSDVPFEKPHEANPFQWAVDQLQEGHVLRRKHWADRKKTLQIIEMYGVPVIYVLTAQAKHVYSFPRHDRDAADWEVV